MKEADRRRKLIAESYVMEAGLRILMGMFQALGAVCALIFLAALIGLL